jgi:hypothetical protein
MSEGLETQVGRRRRPALVRPDEAVGAVTRTQLLSVPLVIGENPTVRWGLGSAIKRDV